MKKFEYKIFQVGQLTASQVDTEINVLGKYGWELCTSYSTLLQSSAIGYLTATTLIFKRELL